MLVKLRGESSTSETSLCDYPQSLVTISHPFVQGFAGGSVVKNLPANEEDARDSSSVSASGRFPEEEMAPIPVFLSRKSHRQRSLVGYSSWTHKESDMTDS